MEGGGGVAHPLTTCTVRARWIPSAHAVRVTSPGEKSVPCTVSTLENVLLRMASFARARSGGSSTGGLSRHSSAGDNTPTSQIDDEDRGSLEPFLPAVVQVFCASAANDWSVPWTRALPVKSTGSGWILDTQRRIIVTNAHVVEFASTLQVRAAKPFAAPLTRRPGAQRGRRGEVRGPGSCGGLSGAVAVISPCVSKLAHCYLFRKPQHQIQN